MRSSFLEWDYISCRGWKSQNPPQATKRLNKPIKAYLKTKRFITFVDICTSFSAVHSSVLSVAGASGPLFSWRLKLHQEMMRQNFFREHDNRLFGFCCLIFAGMFFGKVRKTFSLEDLFWWSSHLVGGISFYCCGCCLDKLVCTLSFFSGSCQRYFPTELNFTATSVNNHVSKISSLNFFSYIRCLYQV